ncbi:MAG: hypothetical protein ACOVNV_09105, partial [Pirellulaceae bacterium]
GIPAKVRVQVRNSGPLVARDIQVRLQAIDSAEAGSAPRLSDPYSGKVQDVPPELIDRLGPGESAALSFQVVFPSSGYHGLHAMLAADAIEPDNHGYAVLAMDQGKQVLVIEATPNSRTDFFSKRHWSRGGPLGQVCVPCERSQLGCAMLLPRISILIPRFFFWAAPGWM